MIDLRSAGDFPELSAFYQVNYEHCTYFTVLQEIIL